MTCPCPPHVGHVTRFAPCAAPEPWQSGHWSGTVSRSVRSLPKIASSKSISSSIDMSSPRWGALASGRRRRPPPPNIPPNMSPNAPPPPPKSDSKMSLKSAPCEKSRLKSKPPGPKFTPWWPNWS